MWCYKAFPQKGSCDYAMKRFVEYQFYILIPDIFYFVVFSLGKKSWKESQ